MVDAPPTYLVMLTLNFRRPGYAIFTCIGFSSSDRRWLGRLLRLSCRRSAPWLGGGTFAYPASSIQPARSPQRSLHCDRLSSIKLPDSERTSPVESFVVPSWYAWGDSWTRSVFLRLARRPSDPRCQSRSRRPLVLGWLSGRTIDVVAGCTPRD